MIHYRIIPDEKVDNKGTEHLAQTVHDYRSIYNRFNGLTKSLTPVSFFSYEMILQPEKTAFYITVPDHQKNLTKKAIETTFPKSSIERTADPLQGIHPAECRQLSLKHHYMFSIRVDRRENSFLPSLLDVLKMMEADERVVVQVLAIPASSDWHVGAIEAYKRFTSGEMPGKWRLNKEGIGRGLIKVVAAGVFEVVDIVHEFIIGEGMEKIDLHAAERTAIVKDGKLSNETLVKARGDAYDTTIHIAVDAGKDRAFAIARMVEMAFRSLDGDNSFEVTSKENKIWKSARCRKPPHKVTADYMGIAEISRLLALPNKALQELHHIESITQLETRIPDALTGAGMLLGAHHYRGKKQNIYVPTNNHDELCLPHVAIGQMGSGKTTYATNLAVEAVRNNFSCAVFDPGDGEVGDTLEKILKPEQVNRIKLAEEIVALNWIETKHSKRGKTRLMNTVHSVLTSSDNENYAQIARYLKAAAMGIQDYSVASVWRILDEKEYRESHIKTMPDGIYKSTLLSFGTESDARQKQILSPILNRLEMILGDEHLYKCLISKEARSLDMVDIMSQRGIVTVFDMKDLEREAKDIFVNILSSKIDIAMTVRPKEKRFPYFVICDEPHQYLKSSSIWRAGVVESRKFRVGFTWLFHSWEQIPRELREIIKSAGVNYHIYPTSKRTFSELLEELHPYQLEDCLKIKRFHAVNIMHVEGQRQTPFICKMNLPK